MDLHPGYTLHFFFFRRHLPFGWSPDLRLTHGPAGNRTTTGSLSATQECRNTNWATRTPTQDTPYNNCGMPQNITSAERRPVPGKSPRKQYSKWSGNCNTSHEPAHPITSSYSVGRPQREQAPPQNAALTRRALEEWERTLCENKAVAILEKLQEGRPALFQKDGGAMLIAIVLDRPLQEAQDLVDQPLQFLQEIKRVLDDQK